MATSDPTLPDAWREWCDMTCERLRDDGLLRSLRTVTPIEGSSASALVDSATHTEWTASAPSTGNLPQDSGELQHELAMFATNDYLGMSVHPEVRAAAATAAAAHGCGPRSSALVCGYTASHRSLEASLANLKHKQECLLFPTGYAANMAVLGALADSDRCAIFSDELNHASIIDGARLAMRAGASLHIYRHNDLEHLDALLRESGAVRKLIISDSLFSMDGDYAVCTSLCVRPHCARP